MRCAKEKGWFFNQHSCFLLQYHLVLVTKYRHPVLTGKVKDFVYSYLQEKMKLAGLNILEMNGEPDHIHILFEAPPSIDLAKMVNGLKTGSSRMTRKNFPDELAPYYWKPAFWSMSYFICTVSDRNAETLKRYIQDQDIK